LEFPNLERAAEGVLHDVLRQREVVHSEDARECGDHPARLTPKEMITDSHYMFIFMIGRTSTSPPVAKMGHPEESSTACPMSLASMSV